LQASKLISNQLHYNLESSTHSLTSHSNLSRAPARPEPRTTVSTTPTRRCFASSSHSNGWAPARTLERAHPSAPTDADKVVEHLQQLFPPLDFPVDVALRVITHASWKGGEEGHNGRMAFIGTFGFQSSVDESVQLLHLTSFVFYRKESYRMLS